MRNASIILGELGELYPDARCELDHRSPLELLVATILSAQSTDRRVNKVTPALFARYPDAAAYASADRDELEELIRPTGFFHNKADALLRLGAQLVSDFGGEVPGITTDTHLIRLSRRFGWTTSDKPAQVEADVAALFEPSDWNLVNHRVIWHGRRRCHARKPACGACAVAFLCPSFGAGPTDPDEAVRLVREPRG